MNAPMTMKAWVLSEAERHGVSPKTIYSRIDRGGYRGVIDKQYVNKRVVFIRIIGEPKPIKQNGRPNVTGLDWRTLSHAEYMRQWRKLKAHSST